MLDGHDRLVAATAERATPPVLGLSLVVPAEEVNERDYAGVQATIGHIAGIRAQGKPNPGFDRDWENRLAVQQRYVEAVYRSRAWPIPGGADEWTREVVEQSGGWWPSEQERPAQ